MADSTTPFSFLARTLDSFIPDTYNIGMIYTLVNSCFSICSSWSMFHQQLILLKEIFQKNGCPENFINRCFKLFLNRIHISKNRFLVEKNVSTITPFLIQKLYHCKLGLNCKGPSKRYSTTVNYTLFLKAKISQNFWFKGPVPQMLTLGVDALRRSPQISCCGKW